MGGAQAYGMVRGRTRAHAGSESAPPPWARREAGVLEGKMHIEDNHWYQIRSALEVLRAPTIGGQFRTHLQDGAALLRPNARGT